MDKILLTHTMNGGKIDRNNIADTIFGEFNEPLSACPSEMEEIMGRIERIKAVAKIHPYAISYDEKRKRWYTMYRDHDGKRHRIESSAQTDLAEKLYEIYEIENSKKRISEIYSEWRSEREVTKEVTQATLDRMEQDWKRFFVKYGWDEKKIGDVKPGELETFIKSVVAAENLTNKSYYHLKGLLFEILRRAHRDGYTEISPRVFFDDMGKVRTRRAVKKDEDDVFTDEERTKICAYLRKNPDTLNRALLLDFLTGLRCGELCALKKSDFSGRYLHVQRTETKQKGKGKDGGSTVVQDWPKTEAGDRMVYLVDEAVGVLIQLLEDPKAKDSEWLLIGVKGNRVIRSTIRRRLSHVCRQVGVPEKSPHKIRKTYASNLIDSGADDAVIKDQMGHQDIRTTREKYYRTHQSDDEKARQLEKGVANY